ncbi:MAG: hypothetical protein Q8S84_04570 [bacterium]|nr:hypothetical protein [bacterium]MDP3380776.1 hypothetical protein [bacterium]
MEIVSNIFSNDSLSLAKKNFQLVLFAIIFNTSSFTHHISICSICHIGFVIDIVVFLSHQIQIVYILIFHQNSCFIYDNAANGLIHLLASQSVTNIITFSLLSPL